MRVPSLTEKRLATENDELRSRLADAEEILRAIRNGDVDALVSDGPAGPRIFALQGLDAESSRFRGEILAQVNDAVIAIDSGGHITYLNPAAERQYGVVASAVLGRRATDVYQDRWQHPDDEASMLAALQARGQWRGESLHVLADGRQFPVESNIAVIRDGSAHGRLAVIRDITERQRSEAALRDADRHKDEFLATLAHELRNPLAPLRNAAQVLQMRGPDTPELRWARDVIDRQVKQMVHLIDDLMDVSRINQGKVELRREHVELARVVQSAVESSRPLIEKYDHALTVMLPPEPVIIDADSTRLAQVLMNLLNNAAKYTERGGRIELRAERLGNELVLAVRDNGIGLPIDGLEGIFGMFSQVVGALSRAHGGLGIGLFLVKRLVELHGGAVKAHSDGLGRGSEFTLRLPIIVEQPSAGELVESPPPAVPVSTLRVVVVDDNVDAAASLTTLLRMMGNTTRTAYDGEQALAVADELRPHVVLLDIGLPKMNGYDVARCIRKRSWGRDVVLVALTGWGQADDRRRSLEAGFDQHLVKPVDPQALMEMLAQMESRATTP